MRGQNGLFLDAIFLLDFSSSLTIFASIILTQSVKKNILNFCEKGMDHSLSSHDPAPSVYSHFFPFFFGGGGLESASYW